LVTRNRECIFGSIEDGKMMLNENGEIVEKELLKSIKIRKNWFFHNWIVMPNHVHLLIEIQENKNTQIENQIPHAQIVETHSSVSTSSISTIIDPDVQNMSIYVAETHCSAPLQCQSDLNFGNNSKIDTQITHAKIVETHSSASTSGISTKINSDTQNMATSVAETHCSAPLQNQTMSKFSNESKLSRKSNSISSFVAIFKSITTKQINGFESIWQQNYHDHVVRNYKRFETIYNYIKNNPGSWETDSINSNFQ